MGNSTRIRSEWKGATTLPPSTHQEEIHLPSEGGGGGSGGGGGQPLRLLPLLTLIDLSRQLRIHFQALNQPERETSVWWLEIEPFRDLIPQGCSVVLRKLFVSKVKTALKVLCHAPGWPELAVAQAASPQPQLDRSPLLQWLN